MPTALNRSAYLNLLDEDRAWLLQQPRTLERDHVLRLIEAEICNPLHLDHALTEVAREWNSKWEKG